MHSCSLILLGVILAGVCNFVAMNGALLRVDSKYDPNNEINPYIKLTVTQNAKYEITATGGKGGGNEFAAGGKGGFIQCFMNLTKDEVLLIVVGSQGQQASQNCAGAGGGGASIVYKKRPRNSPNYDLVLLAPGGGGAGLNVQPNNPDEYEQNTAKVGKCPPSNATSAAGRSFLLQMNLPTNFTSVESEVPVNFTGVLGCKGGFGGGGQGGYGIDKTNASTFGGGGGGGGFKGGLVSPEGNDVTGNCVAGGPGKPYCNAGIESVKCGSPTSHRFNNGYIMFKIHELYKELPKLDRTNYEKPSNPSTRKHSTSNRVSQWLIVCSLVFAAMCRC